MHESLYAQLIPLAKQSLLPDSSSALETESRMMSGYGCRNVLAGIPFFKVVHWYATRLLTVLLEAPCLAIENLIYPLLRPITSSVMKALYTPYGDALLGAFIGKHCSPRPAFILLKLARCFEPTRCRYRESFQARLTCDSRYWNLHSASRA